MKKEYNELLKELKEEKEYNERYNIDEKLESMIRQNNYKNEEINLLRQKNLEMYNQLKSKEEAEDFINNIPDHVALQLQNDNFKIRSNLNTIKNSFREIKNDLENKLERLKNYRLSILEKDGKIIFIWRLEQGSSEHSFGIHVAKLSGIPNQIIDRANIILVNLEKNNRNNVDDNKNISCLTNNVVNDEYKKKYESLRNNIENIDINSLSPIESIIRLNEIQKKLKDS